MNKQLILGLIENGRDSLRRTFEAVPEDKLNWKPLDNGRPALDLFAEVAQTAKMVATLVRSRGEEKPTYETFGQMRAERADWTRETALEAFDANFATLRDELMQIRDEELLQVVSMEIGGGMTLPLGGWAMMAYRSSVSRFAQINYIQTLYGDFESH